MLLCFEVASKMSMLLATTKECARHQMLTKRGKQETKKHLYRAATRWELLVAISESVRSFIRLWRSVHPSIHLSVHLHHSKFKSIEWLLFKIENREIQTNEAWAGLPNTLFSLTKNLVYKNIEAQTWKKIRTIIKTLSASQHGG